MTRQADEADGGHATTYPVRMGRVNTPSIMNLKPFLHPVPDSQFHQDAQKLTRQRDITLILARHSPPQHAQALTHGEAPTGILERNDFVARRRKLGHVGMLLELEVFIVAFVGQRDFYLGLVGFRHAQVEVALELKGVEAAVALEREGQLFFDGDVYAITSVQACGVCRWSRGPRMNSCMVSWETHLS